MKPTLQEIGELLKEKAAASDKHYYGQIQSAIAAEDGTVTGYEVSLGGSSDIVRCRKLAGAKVGDTVMVTLLSSGIAVVTGTVGGDTDAADAMEKALAIEADYMKASLLEASVAAIGFLKADSATIRALQADTAKVHDLTAEQLQAAIGYIEEMITENVTAENIVADHATVENLDANYAHITNGVIDNAQIAYADVQDLDTNYADIRFANIDFSEIAIAKIGELFSESGIIQNIITETGVVTGQLAGVTITGDLIEGNTIKANKLVILGSDGLYYKLNVSGETVEAQQTDYNSINGSHIQAQSITASKIAVSDLVAFRADLAGLKVEEGKIYSLGKSTVGSAVSGVYMDSEGQFSTGDARNFIASWYDTAEEKWKIAIRADEISLGSGQSITEVVTNAAEAAAIPVLRIDSTRGTVFKNNHVSTVLTVTIFVSGQRITNQQALQARFGLGAYLQWYWQRLDDSDFGIIVATDHKLSNDGFSLTLTPEEVDTKVTFRCELITA